MQLPLFQTAIQELSLLQTKWKSILDPVIASVSSSPITSAKYSFVGGSSGIPNSSSKNLGTGYVVYIKVIDTDSAFNPATGVYIIPSNGTYLICLRVSMSPTNVGDGILATGINQTGSTNQSSTCLSAFGNNDNTSAQVSDVFVCSENDVITLNVFQNNGSTLSISNSNSFNSFSIARLGD